MKKTFLVITIALTCFGAFSQAKSGAVKVNPLGLAFGIVNFSYEHALSEKNSAQLGVSIIDLSSGSTSISGFGLNPEFRFYTKEALDKFYFGPIASYSSIKGEDGSDEVTASSFGVGAKLGWNWLLGAEDNFVIDLGLGFQYLTNSVDDNSNLDFSVFDGVLPVINFSLGYAF